jgi:DNA-binding response OmpR family regulator
MTKQKTIAIIDDEENIVDVVKSYLEKSGYKVVYAYSGGEAMALIDKYAPSLIILDLMLPDVSGEDLCRAIRKKSRVPIIMLTAKTQEEDVLSGLGMGADDYVTKPFSPRQLMARVDALLRRVSEEPVPLFSELSMNNGELVADILRHEVRKNGKPVALTPDEYNILMVMLKYPTKVFTRDELIDFALDDEFDGFDRIIDTHIKNIRQKIEIDPKSPRYILTVHGVGYKFGGELDEN